MMNEENGELQIDKAEVVRSVVHITSHYRAGTFCLAELWNMIADSLAVSTVTPALSLLPTDLQMVLREAYAERPESLRPGDSEVRAAVERWCKEGQQH